MVHAGNTGLQKTKIKNTDTLQKLNTIQKKETTQNTATGSVAFYHTRPGNEVGLFYNVPEPTWGVV